MQFSNTTSKNGLIQECEFWTALGDTVISGDSDLLKIFTARINRAYDDVLKVAFSQTDTLRFDDPNHSDHPIATADLTSGQYDYQFTADENGNSVLNITKVLILDSATATDYVPLRRAYANTEEERRALSPDTGDTGIPTHFVEHGGSIFLWPKPNYSATDGIKLFFQRSPDYFTNSDTTQTPGIPETYHQLLALHASLDWLLVNKPDNQMLITRVEAKIQDTLNKFNAYEAARHPRKVRMTTRQNPRE